MEARNDSDSFKVLVVDDEPIVHAMLRRIIQQCELPLTVAAAASSAAEALQLFSDIQPDILLLDVQMDGMNGLDLADRLKEQGQSEPVIIYITAHRSFDYAQHAIRVGAMDYLVKPIRKQKVLEALARAVQRIESDRLERLESVHIRDTLKQIVPGLVSEGGPAPSSRRAGLARAVREYVDEHYADSLDLPVVADELHLSSGYLGGLFKAEYGVTFKAYLRQVRIARAKELMQDPRLNLSEIAERVGYEDISYFSQSFLTEAGVRPSEYRGGGRKWRK